jgi:hypothetical protein
VSYSLGIVSDRKPGSIVSQSADRMADAFDRTARQLLGLEVLSGATYDAAKYRAARAKSQTLLNRMAGTAGATTMDKGEVQQLLLAGIGRIQAAARKLKVTARLDSSYARAYEARIVAQVQRLSEGLGRVASSVRLGGEGTGGLGFIPVIILLVGAAVLADYLGLLDSTDQVLEEYEAICTDPSFTADQRMDCYQRVREQVNKENESDPYGLREISGSVGTVIKVVGIGAAVAGGIYLLWTFGPALMGAGRKVRQAGKRKFA